jgi:uncharacterized protein (TIGR02466 family)
LNLDIKELISFCNAYKQIDKGRVVSNVGGYQSNAISLDKPALKPLAKEIEKHSSLFAKEFINENKQNVLNIWMSINGYKDCNLSHNHPMCDIAGTYYVKTPEDCGNIKFVHPATDVLSYYTYEQKITQLNSYNSQEWIFKPRENTLYLFPGWLQHYVLANNNKKEERISFSFNTNQ